MESGNYSSSSSSSYPRGACDGGVEAETAKEAMEFLSRSWSVSAAQISKALANKNTIGIPQPVTEEEEEAKKVSGRGGYKWFDKEEKKKDKVRAEKAEAHAALCVAGLATALASITRRRGRGSLLMEDAVASAAEVLASRCCELAQSAGAPPHVLVSALQSALNIQTPTHLLTLTAAAATALRGEAALKARFPKPPPNKTTTATVIPYDDDNYDKKTGMAAAPTTLEQMLQQVYKGGLHWKHVSIYINTDSQLMIKLKSNHVGGAFSTKNKGVVYGVCNEKGSWPFCKERENADSYFGVKTAKGLLEFKCNDTLHKQKWVHTIQHLLLQTTKT